MKKTKTF